MLRGGDMLGLGANYIAAVGAPEYARAFQKLLVHGNGAHLRMTREKQDALQRVVAADEQRAMSLTGSAGGFGVPFELDPTIMLSSNGFSNPLRELATVTTITTDLWRGVSSAGITAAFAAEATEATDNAPTLGQPTISTEKAQAFVPFSIKIGMDYVGLQEELGGLLTDAKDTLEATKWPQHPPQPYVMGVVTGAVAENRRQPGPSSRPRSCRRVAGVQTYRPACRNPRAPLLRLGRVRAAVGQWPGSFRPRCGSSTQAGAASPRHLTAGVPPGELGRW